MQITQLKINLKTYFPITSSNIKFNTSIGFTCFRGATFINKNNIFRISRVRSHKAKSSQNRAHAFFIIVCIWQMKTLTTSKTLEIRSIRCLKQGLFLSTVQVSKNLKLTCFFLTTISSGCCSWHRFSQLDSEFALKFLWHLMQCFFTKVLLFFLSALLLVELLLILLFSSASRLPELLIFKTPCFLFCNRSKYSSSLAETLLSVMFISEFSESL